jgi:hypothetical protein
MTAAQRAREVRQAFDESRVFARRTLNEGRRNEVTISLSAPQEVGFDEWLCAYEMKGPSRPRRFDGAYGIDAVQAVELALNAVRIWLERSGRTYEWLLQDTTDGGFPQSMPSAFGPEFRKAISAVVDNALNARSIVQRHWATIRKNERAARRRAARRRAARLRKRTT